jgi:transcription initiation factor TFIIH subunit 3
MANERPQLKPRILVVNVSPDISSQYVPMMNTILAAQKLVIHIPIISIRSGRSTIPFK